MLGTFALSAGYYDAYYGRAQRVRTKIADDFRTAFAECDFVVTPTSPTVAFKLGERTDDPLAMYLSDYCTVPMSLAGIPAISIPAGLARPADGGPPAACRSASRSPGRRSRRTACSTPRYALEQAIGFDITGGVPVSGRLGEPVIGLEIHVQLSTRTKMFCGCELSFGEPPNTRTCPVCLGHPGTLPTLNAQAVHYGLMIALALGCEVAPAVDLPPQELLLSRPAEGLPDQPVRHPAGVGRPGSTSAATALGAHPPRPPRGGRGEADPPGRVGPHPRRRLVGRRLQPRRHAAGRDRHRARPALRGGRREFAAAAAHDAEADRRLRREHGGGLAALRRERVGARGRRRRATAPRPS